MYSKATCVCQIEVGAAVQMPRNSLVFHTAHGSNRCRTNQSLLASPPFVPAPWPLGRGPGNIVARVTLPTELVRRRYLEDAPRCAATTSGPVEPGAARSPPAPPRARRWSRLQVSCVHMCAMFWLQSSQPFAQGNRVNESSGATRLARKSSSQPAALRLSRSDPLPGRLSDQVVGHVLDGGEIGWSVIGSDPALVVAEDHVHHPMQAVLDRPVAADDRPQKTCQQDQGGDVETCLPLDLVAGLISRMLSTMTTAFRPGQSWRSCSQATSWMTVVVLVSMRP